MNKNIIDEIGEIEIKATDLWLKLSDFEIQDYDSKRDIESTIEYFAKRAHAISDQLIDLYDELLTKQDEEKRKKKDDI